MLKVGSLFSGAGLCDLGLHWAGFRHQWFCEIDPFCRAVLARRWPDIPIYEDVRMLKGDKLPPVDVLCGGFPCQDVSSGGLRAGIRQGTRSGLWLEYARLIGEIRRNTLSSKTSGACFPWVSTSSSATWPRSGIMRNGRVLPAAALGAPHHRERVFIVAYPYSVDLHNERLLSPLERIVGEHFQPHDVSGWLGIRFDRTRKDAAVQAYGNPVLYRVDDGRPGGLDESGRPFSCSAGMVSPEVKKSWEPRLKALGNAITPQQAYAVGACIVAHEGMQAAPLTFYF